MKRWFQRDEGPFVLEWCSMGEQKGTFHIDTLAATVKRNLYVFTGQSPARYTSPWLIVGVFATNEEAHQYCDHLQAYQAQNPAWQGEDDDRIFIPATENPIEVVKLRAMPYRLYLRTEHWQRIRKDVLQRAQYRCQVCNASGLVDVHHRSYEHKGQERYSDVIVLCRKCHELFHTTGKLAEGA